jgi:hypothetical protein
MTRICFLLGLHRNVTAAGKRGADASLKAALAAGIALPALLAGTPAVARQAPDPMEVYELIRTNLSGVTDAQLQTAAVEGLVRQLQPRVWLASGNPVTNEAPALISKTARFDGSVAYLRIGRVGNGLAAAVREAYDAQAKTNQPAGLILDLRFAEGDDYAAAAAVADIFATEEKPLLDWGKGSAKSTAKTDAWHMPVVALVNRETAVAAEALAASLRDIGSALLIGTNTAGRAMIATEFRLSNGQTLCIARAGVKIGDGNALTADGLRPDVAVAVAPAEEQAFWLDPTKPFGRLANVTSSTNSAGTNVVAGTNRVSAERINEAALVRERQKGAFPKNPPRNASTQTPVAAAAPVVRDPALARALDVIKALALVRQWKAP